MAELFEFAAQLGILALGAGLGSLLMWMFVGPFVLRRAGPGIFRGVVQNIFSLSDAELDAPDVKGDMMKAIAKKQAASVYGAMGALVKAAPTEELEALAKKHGFASVSDAADKLGGMVGSGIDGGAVAKLAAGLSNGKKNPFSGVVDLFVALNAFSQMAPEGGGNGGASGMPALPGLGGGGRQSSVQPRGW